MELTHEPTTATKQSYQSQLFGVGGINLFFSYIALSKFKKQIKQNIDISLSKFLQNIFLDLSLFDLPVIFYLKISFFIWYLRVFKELIRPNYLNRFFPNLPMIGYTNNNFLFIGCCNITTLRPKHQRLQQRVKELKLRVNYILGNCVKVYSHLQTNYVSSNCRLEQENCILNVELIIPRNQNHLEDRFTVHRKHHTRDSISQRIGPPKINHEEYFVNWFQLLI